MNDIADLHIERQQDTYIAVLSGEIDPSNARDLARQLTTAVPNDAMAVVVDLSDVQPSAPHVEGGLDRVGDPSAGRLRDRQPIDDDFDFVFPPAIELGNFIERIGRPIDADAARAGRD